jgi:hypothetical protein
MATTQILSNAVNTVANTPQTLFTAGTSGVVIESFTASNTSNVDASYRAFIVSTGVEQPQIPFEIVVWGRNKLGIGIVNQIIPAGAELKLECSAIDSIYFTATGRSV